MANQHKYLKREKINGKWKYWYYEPQNKNAKAQTPATNPAKTAAQNAKNMVQQALNFATKKASEKAKAVDEKIDKTVDKAKAVAVASIKQVGKNISDSTLKTVNEKTKNLDTVVKKANDVVNVITKDENNMYVTDSKNYKKKLEEVKKTKEWQDIVAKQDPEYVKTNPDGTKKYLIDDYLVDKKHPVLDILGDIAAGRSVDTNEITMESAVAGIKDYATSAINTGMLAVGLASTLLTERFKLQQGSYDDEIDNIRETVDSGAQYVNNVVETANKVESKAAEYERVGIPSTSSISEADARRLLAMIDTASSASEAKAAVDEGRVVEAAQILLDSTAMKNTMGDDEYYKLAEKALSDLSPEEIMLINLMYREAMGQRG